ncbi:MAG: hypothetical protein LUC36_04050 [Oscillospiraceae bacterium]|nr:hypothetical protein [Oscillospiraceae bacterium]
MDEYFAEKLRGFDGVWARVSGGGEMPATASAPAADISAFLRSESTLAGIYRRLAASPAVGVAQRAAALYRSVGGSMARLRVQCFLQSGDGAPVQAAAPPEGAAPQLLRQAYIIESGLAADYTACGYSVLAGICEARRQEVCAMLLAFMS